MIRFSKYPALALALLWLASPLEASPWLIQDEKKEEMKEEMKQEEGSEGSAAKEGNQAVTMDKSFAGLLARYEEVSGKLDELKRQFDEAESSEDSTRFRDQYARMVEEAKLLDGEIRVAGVAMLDEGKKDEQVMETLTGVMINDAFFERDAAALELGQKLIDGGVDVAILEQAAETERLGPTGKDIVRELVLRAKEAAADDLPRVKLTTSKGEVVLELFENDAPETVANFISLVNKDYYNGLTFHRVLDNFMAQGGCPLGNGRGDPGYKIRCECYQPQYRRHFTGSLSMAKGDARNSGGSQFFLTFRRTSNLDGKHTVFGRVIEGMDIVNSIQRIDPQRPNPNIKADVIEKAEVLRDRGHEYEPNKIGG